MKSLKFIIPLGIFVALCVFLGIGLTKDPRIVIVDIDEKSLNAEGRWPWSRDILARLFYGTRIALRSLGTGRTRITLRTRVALRARVALRTDVTLRTRSAGRASRSAV